MYGFLRVGNTEKLVLTRTIDEYEKRETREGNQIFCVTEFGIELLQFSMEND